MIKIKAALATLMLSLPLAGAMTMTAIPQAHATNCVVNVESWDRLNVRSGPGASYNKKFSIGPGQCGVRFTGDCEGSWCQIRFRGRSGWVNSRFIGSEAEGGDDSVGRQHRFNRPKYDGFRLDARYFRSSNFDMPGTANRFCRSKGFSGMVDYRVQTSHRTIARGDGHIFNNSPNSNTTYRFIVCE
ncbi:MAG: SH3 domain-containing protein [Anderseniella sp.]